MTDIIKNPRVTEKASFTEMQGVYTFDISSSATKSEIKKAIFKLYKVIPVKVNVLKVPKTNTSFRGQRATKGGGRKALVYLKKGDKIEFV